MGATAPTSQAAVHRPVSRRLVLLMWTGCAVLLLIGIVAAGMRALHLGDLAARIEPLRIAALGALGVSEPDVARRAEGVGRMDANFGAHAVATLLHVGSGALLFALVPLQFSRRVRTRHRAVHRWSGRLLVVAAWVAGLGGLYFGVLHPFAGIPERLFIGAIGTWFLAATTIAFVMIRRGRTAEHREWMLRSLGAALAVSLVRVVSIPIDLALTPFGAPIEVVILNAFWVGWLLSILGAEWWVRRTRPPRPAAMRLAAA